MLKRNLADLKACSTACFSDAASANVDGVKSQWDMVRTSSPRVIVRPQYARNRLSITIDVGAKRNHLSNLEKINAGMSCSISIAL